MIGHHATEKVGLCCCSVLFLFVCFFFLYIFGCLVFKSSLWWHLRHEEKGLLKGAEIVYTMCVYMYELAGVHITHDTFYEFCQGSLFDVKPNKVYKQFKLFRIVDNLLFYRIFAFRHKMFNYFFFNFFSTACRKSLCYRDAIDNI